MLNSAQNCAADAYTINAIAAIVRREGTHDYNRTAGFGMQVASLCGLTVVWSADAITVSGRDIDVTMENGMVTFIRGHAAILCGWHRVLADLDNVFLRRAA